MMGDQIARNIIRTGIVHSVDYATGSVKVIIPEKDDQVTDFLPMLSFEYHMPLEGAQVLCVFLGADITSGFCLGAFYSSINKPSKTGNLYSKVLDAGCTIEFNKDNRVMKIALDGLKIELSSDSLKINDGTEGVPLGGQLKKWLDEHTHLENGMGRPKTESPSPSEVVKI